MKQDASESYYFFDDENREVVFRRHDMPTPWLNYLTNGTLTTMISQAGGGLTFYKSPQIWRITRYKFFHIPMDRGGLYIYIRNAESGEVWSPTNEPCRVAPEKWESAHGMGYTRFAAEHNGLQACLNYWIGEENALICDLSLTSDRLVRLEIYAFAELGMMEFLREIQWQCYNKHQLSVEFESELDALIYTYGVDSQPRPQDTPLVYFAASRKCDGFDGDRDEFVGCYRDESNPYAIECGGCTGSTLKGGDPQFAMQFNLTLEAGGEERLQIFLGTGMDRESIGRSLDRLRSTGFVDGQFSRLKDRWTEYLSHFTAQIPCAEAQRMIDVWNPYQAHRNFLFSRNISYYATGTVRGVGFRDTAQDIMAIIPFDTHAAREKLLLLLSQQYRDGHTNHYFFPEEHWAPLHRVHSDNHLWIVLAVYRLVAEEGSKEFLTQEAPYYDGGSGTVWEHLERSIAFTASHLGKNGFPLMLHSDWNDMLNKVCREGKGESIFVAETLCLACAEMTRLCELLGMDASAYLRIREEQAELLNSVAWDGEWFRRATMDSGEFLGSRDCSQAKIWLNTQSWAVLSGAADREKCVIAMDSVKKLLDTPFGIKKIDPSMKDYPSKEDPLTNYNKGCGENGSIFCHANTWAVIAECILGRGARAFEYYYKLLPENAMRTVGVWRYKAEPYVYSSNLFGPESDKPGLANVSWLTGTSSWMYIAATQYILGVRPVYEGLLIDPCIPPEWDFYRVKRIFRGCTYDIEIHNPEHVECGVREILLDGEPVKGPILSAKNRANVRVTMGGESR